MLQPKPKRSCATTATTPLRSGQETRSVARVEGDADGEAAAAAAVVEAGPEGFWVDRRRAARGAVGAGIWAQGWTRAERGWDAGRREVVRLDARSGERGRNDVKAIMICRREG